MNYQILQSKVELEHEKLQRRFSMMQNEVYKHKLTENHKRCREYDSLLKPVIINNFE